MKKNTILIIVIVAALAGGVYFYYQGSATPGSDTLQTEISPEVQASATRVLNLLNQIKSLKIDGSLFKSAEFQTLQDYSVPIPPVDVGRVNPFAPLPGNAPAPSPSRTPAPVRR